MLPLPAEERSPADGLLSCLVPEIQILLSVLHSCLRGAFGAVLRGTGAPQPGDQKAKTSLTGRARLEAWGELVTGREELLYREASCAGLLSPAGDKLPPPPPAPAEASRAARWFYCLVELVTFVRGSVPS